MTATRSPECIDELLREQSHPMVTRCAATWAFHHYDARGHCTLLTDSVGNILEQYEYDAFGWPYFYDARGNPIGAIDPIQNLWEGYSLFGNRFLFTGREWIPELKLYDFRNRLYQPELGRFLQPDPKHFQSGDYNLYRYCHNDPVNRMDPTGLQASSSDEVLNKPNLTAFGQGDWMRVGSPFTNGEMLGKVKDYVAKITDTVNKAVDKANAASRNVKWSASFSNWLKSPENFKDPSVIAKTEWSTKSTAVMNAGTVASFNVNLQININWNAGQSAYFGSALRTDNADWRGRTGEIEHARDAARALTSSYGGARPAVEIANEQAASMVGHYMGEGWASTRMNTALRPWADATMVESHLEHDVRSMEHKY